MNRLVQQLLQTPWLIAALVGGSLAIALPSQAGKVPTGLNSGVTVGGSTLLPLGGSSLGEEEFIESTSPNATVDPLTGEVTLTAAAQQQVNQSATNLLQGLETSSPALAALLTTPGEINLLSISLAGASGGGETEDSATVREIATAAAATIANGESVSLTSSQGTLDIAAPTPIAGANPTDPSAIRATSAIFTPEGGTPVVVPLQGTQAQIANATGFLAAAFAAGFTPSQVAPFTEMALAGASYIDLVALFNAVGGLLLQAQSGDTSVNTAVDATQLEAAIQAYNSILNSSDAATLAALNQNSDFVTLGRSLQQLRAAVDL